MAFSALVPQNDELLTNFPALCRANWDGIVLGTDANLLITNAKIAAGAGIVDTKLAQITTATKVHGTSITGLASLPAGAGVVPDANSNGKMKADASDTTPQYLDSLLDTGVFQISAGDLLQLKDGGVETVKLVNGSASPGNSKYYGTDSGGTKGFFSFPADEKVKASSTGTAGYLDAIVDDVTVEIATNILQVKDAGISQAKLKTSQGEVSGTIGTGQTDKYGVIGDAIQTAATYATTVYYIDRDNNTGVVFTLPGGEYGFFPQFKRAGATGYLQQRYVTASGKDHWIFLLIAKISFEELKLDGSKTGIKFEKGQIMSSWQAPDHPSYGNGGDELELAHPFGDYDKSKQELVVVDNSILTELKPLITRKNSLLTLVNEKCLIDDSKRPKYEPREIVEIDEIGDMKGDVIERGKTPDWAKIKIMKDEYELKRRMVETLPSNILYKKLKIK